MDAKPQTSSLEIASPVDRRIQFSFGLKWKVPMKDIRKVESLQAAGGTKGRNEIASTDFYYFRNIGLKAFRLKLLFGDDEFQLVAVGETGEVCLYTRLEYALVVVNDRIFYLQLQAKTPLEYLINRGLKYENLESCSEEFLTVHCRVTVVCVLTCETVKKSGPRLARYVGNESFSTIAPLGSVPSGTKTSSSTGQGAEEFANGGQQNASGLDPTSRDGTDRDVASANQDVGQFGNSKQLQSLNPGLPKQLSVGAGKRGLVEGKETPITKKGSHLYEIDTKTLLEMHMPNEDTPWDTTTSSSAEEALEKYTNSGQLPSLSVELAKDLLVEAASKGVAVLKALSAEYLMAHLRYMRTDEVSEVLILARQTNHKVIERKCEDIVEVIYSPSAPGMLDSFCIGHTSDSATDDSTGGDFCLVSKDVGQDATK